MTAIRDILSEHERSQTWLAGKVQRSPKTVERWCSGETRPDVLEAMGLALFFGVPAEPLLRELGHEPPNGRTTWPAST